MLVSAYHFDLFDELIGVLAHALEQIQRRCPPTTLQFIRSIINSRCLPLARRFCRDSERVHQSLRTD